ncbi:MAG TPA: hypothetical protein DCP28_07950 [Cytophagales bacterium]|nr:hypothetical protein [Cytophagales bacterium]
MLVRALTVSNNQDLLIAVAATVISILLAWNNHRMYTRPFQAVLQLGKDGFTLTDRKQSLHFQPESIQEFILLSDDNASNLFIKLDNQNVKPLLFRFSGKPTEQLQQDMEAMKKQAENLLGKAK